MKHTSIDEYIAAQPEALQPRLAQIRQILRSRVESSTEALKWRSPAILHPDGMIMVIFSAHKNQINITVTPSAKEAVEEKLAGFETGKGSLMIPHTFGLPIAAIEALIDERVREYRENGAKWM